MVPNIITWGDFPSKKQNILSDVSHLTEVTWLPSTLQQTQKNLNHYSEYKKLPVFNACYLF